MLNDISPHMPVRLLGDWEDVPKGYTGTISGEQWEYDPDADADVFIGVHVDFHDRDGFAMGTAGPIPIIYLERDEK